MAGSTVQSQRAALKAPVYQRSKWKHWLTVYGFLIPALLLFAFFELFSLLFNIYMGFHKWRGFGEPEFVGLSNYLDLFIANDRFWNALFNNFIYMAVALGVMTVFGLLIALVLDSGMPGAELFRGLLFLPVITPMVVVSLAWTRVYSTQGGLLNQALELVGFTGLAHDWLGDPKTALPAILVVWVWRHLGYGVIMFYAGLLGIPGDLKDAAALDGASPWQTAWYVIVPLLRSIIMLVSIWFAIYAFKVFTLVFVMTGGGPYNATEVLNTYMYERVFVYFDLGTGSAITNLVIVILVLFATLRGRFQAELEF